MRMRTWGMLRSSTKMTAFLPTGGPNTPLRLRDTNGIVNEVARATGNRAGGMQRGIPQPKPNPRCMAHLLSSLASMRYCVMLAVVRALKPITLGGT